MNRLVRWTSLPVAALTALSLSGCLEKKSDDEGADAIAVTATNDGCDVSTDTAESGTVSFEVKNDGSDVTEFYMLADDELRIIGEVENIAPGTSRKLTFQAQPGDYFTVCKPGMVGDGVGQAAFTVTGDAVSISADDEEAFSTAVANYTSYVKAQTESLKPAVESFVDAYKAGDDEQAKALFPAARVFYERIEPTAEQFGDLDPKIDYRKPGADAEGLPWTGFHRIEADLWYDEAQKNYPDGSIAKLTPEERATVGDQLVADIQSLYDQVHSADFVLSIGDITNGAIGLLDEVAAPDGKLPGEEDEFSHTDLSDFYANVEGAEVAYGNVRDIASAKGADGEELVSTLDAQFKAMKDLLSTYGSYEAGFTSYETVDQTKRNELGAQLNALSEPLSKLTSSVLGVSECSLAWAAVRPPTRAPKVGAHMTDENLHEAHDAEPASGVSRRGLLRVLAGTAGGVALGAGAAAAVAIGVEEGESSADGHVEDTVYPFYGEHQAGITTPVQKHLYLASYDLTLGAGRDQLQSLLKDWSEAAARITQGLDVSETGAVGGSPLAPPDDTGEALGLAPNGLTITIGLGPRLFQDEKFGLVDKRPPLFEPLPSFAFELLDDATSGGDLCIQACADDPQVAVHAIRNLSRIGFGRAQIRWAQLGYGRTSSTSREQETPRNLFGFKDGTANIKSEEPADIAKFVWSEGEGQDWFAGGTYLVTRKIQMLIESWDRTRLEEQEAIIGRDKGEGAPLSGGEEFTEPDFGMASTKGGMAIPADSHVRLAHPDFNDGARILRRGYNYVEGNNNLGQISGGLFFIGFQNDPGIFIRIQNALAKDSMNEYIRHIASGLFAIPRGAREGEYVGQDLFA